MSWDEEIRELERRKEMARGMGGPESVAFHHGRGKLTVRERIDLLADPGSLREIGILAGEPNFEGATLRSLLPSNTVIGTCLVEGRRIAFSGGDFTIRGGAADAAVGNKHAHIEELALATRIPFVRLLDATGGSVRSFEHIGRTYIPDNPGGDLATRLLQEVPVVSAVMGSVAGLPALQACMCHFSVMVKGTSQLFVAGPAVVKEATGREITKEELGDERTHTTNGVIMNLATSEADAIAQVRRFLSYLPSHVSEPPPRTACTDDPSRREEALLSAIPRNRRQVYDAGAILDAVLDRGSLFEIGSRYGRSRITGLARIAGIACGVMIHNPKHHGGAMTQATAEKVLRLIELCDTFRLPLIYLADEPGFAVGPEQEKLGILRTGARVMASLAASRMPYLCVVLRQLYGVAGGLHRRSTGFYRRWAWPSAHWGSMHIEGGTSIAYKREIESASDPAAKRAEIEARLQAIASPFRNAHAFNIEDIIDPRDTRALLAEALEDAVRLTAGAPPPGIGLTYRP